MLLFYLIFLLILTAFSGYLLGRFSHAYLNIWLNNPSWAIHHWVYGLIFIFIGLIFSENVIFFILFGFGFGLLISDLKDFLSFKILGPDNCEKKRFWHID